MQSTATRRIVALTFAICLLVPGLIYSDGHHDPQVKLTPVKTTGTAPATYTLTPTERDKLSTALPSSSPPAARLQRRDNASTPAPAGEYAGPTAAELMKLQRELDNARVPQRPRERVEPVSTIELVPRNRGPEGLTEAERVKLEAWMKMRSNSPSGRRRGSQ